jgi:hypothetical protein
MHRVQAFLSSPWTPSKVWTLVSVPLSAAGIANITQSFMDLGALVIYILIFYEKLIEMMVSILNDLNIELDKQTINIIVIATPYSMPFINTYTNEYKNIYLTAVNKKKYPEFIIKIATIIALPFYSLQYFFYYIITPFVHLSFFLLRFVFTLKLDGNFISDMDHKRASEIGFHRTCLILMILIIVSAFSFGIERWVNPEFLRLKPEHFDFNAPSQLIRGEAAQKRPFLKPGVRRGFLRISKVQKPPVKTHEVLKRL